MGFNFFVSSNIDFGRGALADLPEIIKRYNMKSAMIVYDGGVKAAGIADKVVAEVENAGVSYCIFDGVIPNPTNEVVEEAAVIAKDAGVDLTYSIHKYLFPHIENSTEPSPLLVEKVEKGELGFKTGKGFQEWSEEEIAASRKNLTEGLIKVAKALDRL